MEGVGEIMKLKKIFICGLIVFTACVSFPLAAAVSDFSDVEIDDEFLPFLTAKKRLMTSSGVKDFTMPGQKGRIIVCIVSIASKGNSARAVANMTKVCRIKAQVELLKTQGVFLQRALSRNCTVSSKTALPTAASLGSLLVITKSFPMRLEAKTPHFPKTLQKK